MSLPVSGPYPRQCWCGSAEQFAYSGEFNVCKTCGTLVTTAPENADIDVVTADSGELYSKDYWLNRQSEKYGLPPIQQRARLDLPERCIHWLRLLLSLKTPGAKTLEVGCAHGGYVALMRWAGYDAEGTEMSPWVVNFARETFHVPVSVGTLDQQAHFKPQSFDAIILNDVIEHLPSPIATLRHATSLLKPGGVVVIQTPEYKEHLTYADLVASGDSFRTHMDGKNEEHLYLYSRRSTELLWERLGLPIVSFHNPIFPYDLFYTASDHVLAPLSVAEIDAALLGNPLGRLVRALLDKAFESDDRWWGMKRLEAQLKENIGPNGDAAKGDKR